MASQYPWPTSQKVNRPWEDGLPPQELVEQGQRGAFRAAKFKYLGRRALYVSEVSFFLVDLPQSRVPQGDDSASPVLLQPPSPTSVHPVFSGQLIWLPHGLETSAPGLGPHVLTRDVRHESRAGAEKLHTQEPPAALRDPQPPPPQALCPPPPVLLASHGPDVIRPLRGLQQLTQPHGGVGPCRPWQPPCPPS